MNGTLAEEEGDPFGDDPSQFQDVLEYWLPFSLAVNIFKDILLSLVILVAEGFAIYLFCRFSELRKKLNIYIFNMCLLDALAQLKSIIDFFFVYILSLETLVSVQHFYCIAVQFYKCGISLYYVISLCLALEWFVTSYRPHLLKIPDKFRTIFILALDLIYVFMSIAAAYSYNCYNNWTEYVVYTSFILFLVTLIVLNILVRQTDLRKSYAHTCYAFDVSNVVVACYFPLLLYHILMIDTKLPLVMVMIILFTLFVPQTIAHAHFLVVLFVLYKKNVDVRNVLTRHFKGLENFNDDTALTKNMENEANSYIHADNFGSVEDTRRISSFM